MAKVKSKIPYKVKSKVPFINAMRDADPLYEPISNAIAEANLSPKEYEEYFHMLLGWCNKNHNALEGFVELLADIKRRRS